MSQKFLSSQESGDPGDPGDHGDHGDHVLDLVDPLHCPELEPMRGEMKRLWDSVGEGDTSGLMAFEDLIKGVSRQFQKMRQEQKDMEAALKNCNRSWEETVSVSVETVSVSVETASVEAESAFASQVKKMSEELEAELEAERAKLQRSEQIPRPEEHKQEAILQQQVEELLRRNEEMKEVTARLQSEAAALRDENRLLRKEQMDTKSSLESEQRELEELRILLERLDRGRKDERRVRARAALHAAQNVAIERENLVKELSTLRDYRKRTMDDADEAEANRLGAHPHGIPLNMSVEPRSSPIVPDRPRFPPAFRTEVNFLESPQGADAERGAEQGNEWGEESQAESGECYAISWFENVGTRCSHRRVLIDRDAIRFLAKATFVRAGPQEGGEGNGRGREHGRRLRLFGRVSSWERQAGRPAFCSACRFSSFEFSASMTGRFRSPVAREPVPRADPAVFQKTRTGRGATLPMVTEALSHQMQNLGRKAEPVPKPPERIFKVILLGDSGVGKSSILRRCEIESPNFTVELLFFILFSFCWKSDAANLHRFCEGRYRPSYSATIGVDFRVKTLRMAKHDVCLQIWDTAGQERFRSITTHYYRKADGVMAVYDITCEESFKNVRSWICAVRENAGEHAAIVVLGNKVDLAEERSVRVVSPVVAAQLAASVGGVSYETSAKTGLHVFEAFRELAMQLEDKQDTMLIEGMQLENHELRSSRKCC
ncbi:unnamed protein product [Darwinula stevensoni]|uniref:Ras and EF-hand domain-containing protein n=1 Tax=Darwinula stevensoni TaxID=69355 RepID=A0A7R9FN65_9CRUS|nr:unnamed protein product [Darwinula stevensoni]CAG0896172.1 unnamed protein product [Darwinula stevensoni]